MKLRDWRKKHKLTQAEVAEKLTKIVGSTVTHDQISRIENGQVPALGLCLAVERLTERAVTPSDFSQAA